MSAALAKALDQKRHLANTLRRERRAARKREATIQAERAEWALREEVERVFATYSSSRALNYHGDRPAMLAIARASLPVFRQMFPPITPLPGARP